MSTPIRDAPALGPEVGALNAVFMQMPVAICIIEGKEHVFRFANPAFCALVGDRELIGKPMLKALPQLRGQGFDTLLDGVMATGQPFIGNEMRAQLSTPTTDRSLFVNFVYAPKFNRDGIVDGVLVSGTDVTELVHARRRAELAAEQLRTSEERLRQLLEASGAGTWEMEVATQDVTASARFRELFSLRQIARINLSDCIARIHVDDVERVSAVVTSAMAGANGGSYTDEYRLVSPNPSRDVWVEARGQLRFDTSGNPTRLHGTVFDITQRKELEIAQERRADFERQLIGIVSHDLRNPLSVVVLGCSVLLRAEGLSDALTKTVVRINNAGERASRMIRDLLDFTQARLGAGLHIATSPQDFHALTAAVVEEIETSFAGRVVRCTYSGDGRGRWDPDRISQMIENLVTNALKYGAVDAAVTVTSDCLGDIIVLSVHNYGLMIPPEKLADIFQPLERATHAHSAARSIGLGLYIVKQVVNSHNGTISVESTERNGTTFTARIPRSGPAYEQVDRSSGERNARGGIDSIEGP